MKQDRARQNLDHTLGIREDPIVSKHLVEAVPILTPTVRAS